MWTQRTLAQTGFWKWHRVQLGGGLRVLLVVAAMMTAIVSAHAAEEISEPAASITTSAQTGNDFVFLEQQIYRGEAGDAQNQLETIVAQIEATYHRYHEELLTPLTLLGDALMVQQQYAGALDYYARARHVSRVSFGLFDPRQVDVVYREADAFTKMGDLDSAGKREEYAYEVLHRTYDRYDPKLLPALGRLGDFYLETYNYLAARSLYNRAMNVHIKNDTDYAIEAIPTLQGIAQSHRLERFPPFYVANVDDSRLQGPTPHLTTTDLDRQYLSFNNFPAGEKALQKIVEIRRREVSPNTGAILDAILELADWHLMFGRSDTANTLYSHIYKQMAKRGNDAGLFFGTPALIYLPLPHDPKPPSVSKGTRRTAGVVTLQFNVAPSGRIRKMKTIASEPPKLMDFRVRRSMRLAIFRPKLVEGVAVMAETQTYSHQFEYFPAHTPNHDIPADPTADTAQATQAVES